VVSGRTERVLTEWRKRAKVLGRQVRVDQGRHVFHGQALDIDEKGALWVRNDQGMVERVVSGDVTALGF
jgi:BirA family biotin operon repressor/biotin-[acetyl-CoA-carboxylase] ligase